MKKYIKIFLDKKKITPSRIIGLLIIIASIIIIIFPFYITRKIGITLFLIGFFILGVLPVKMTSIKIKKKTYKRMSGMIITLIVITWIFLMFYFTSFEELEIFLILVIIGVLTVIYLLEEFVDSRYKNRMKAIFYLFFIAFFLIVGQKIINILNM